MPKFAANLTMMFNEVPFLERFAEALAVPVAANLATAPLVAGMCGRLAS